MFIILIIVMILQVSMYVKTYQSLPLKHVQFIVCELYFNKAVKTNKSGDRVIHAVQLNMPLLHTYYIPIPE